MIKYFFDYVIFSILKKTPQYCHQGCLQVLNVSANNLSSIRELEQLQYVQHLMANDNNLSGMKELAYLLSAWPMLARLDLMGNPLCLKAKYKDRIIVMGKHLGMREGLSYD